MKEDDEVDMQPRVGQASECGKLVHGKGAKVTTKRIVRESAKSNKLFFPLPTNQATLLFYFSFLSWLEDHTRAIIDPKSSKAFYKLGQTMFIIL